MKIYKYPLPLEIRNGFAFYDARAEIEMPAHAKVLSVGEQRGQAFVWAFVDETLKPKTRSFRILATGLNVPIESTAEVWTPIGVIHFGYVYVFHIFEVSK